MPLDPDQLAARVAQDIEPGSFVNLGIGQPTKVADHLPAEVGVVLHTENGMLGMAPRLSAMRLTLTSPMPARSPSPNCPERRISTTQTPSP